MFAFFSDFLWNEVGEVERVLEDCSSHGQCPLRGFHRPVQALGPTREEGLGGSAECSLFGRLSWLPGHEWSYPAAYILLTLFLEPSILYSARFLNIRHHNSAPGPRVSTLQILKPFAKGTNVTACTPLPSTRGRRHSGCYPPITLTVSPPGI